MTTIGSVSPRLTARMIKQFEGFRSEAYRCPAGVWTIGYGSTKIGGKPVKPGQKITERDAYDAVCAEISALQTRLAKFVNRPLTEGQASALLDFAYNCGPGALIGSSLLKAVNRGEDDIAAQKFYDWVFSRGVKLPGLEIRRAAESALYSGADPEEVFRVLRFKDALRLLKEMP